eukprot:7347476-Alexandrium_andersonii.AAC.1
MSGARRERSRWARGARVSTEVSFGEPQPGVGARLFAMGHVGVSNACSDAGEAARWPKARMRAR